MASPETMGTGMWLIFLLLSGELDAFVQLR
jgi:hypothetical protein